MAFLLYPATFTFSVLRDLALMVMDDPFDCPAVQNQLTAANQ